MPTLHDFSARTITGEDAVRAALRQLRDAGADECFLVPTSADATELDRLRALLG